MGVTTEAVVASLSVMTGAVTTGMEAASICIPIFSVNIILKIPYLVFGLFD